MYGYDPNQLEQYISKPSSSQALWGTVTDIVSTPYAFQRWSLRNGHRTPALSLGVDATLYVEEGALQVEGRAETPVHLGSDRLIHLSASAVFTLLATAETVVYLFGNTLPSAQAIVTKDSTKPNAASILSAETPSDYRDKYWGDIRTLVNGDVAGKRLFLKGGNTGSLEFHVQKHESYYVHSGELALLLRAGRAENRMFTLPAGSTVYLPPGLMHQRGALADTVIIEISTRDSDSDSFLVEDGTRQPMAGFRELIEARRAGLNVSAGAKT